jgi:hypothetical protein
VKAMQERVQALAKPLFGLPGKDIYVFFFYYAFWTAIKKVMLAFPSLPLLYFSDRLDVKILFVLYSIIFKIVNTIKF